MSASRWVVRTLIVALMILVAVGCQKTTSGPSGAGSAAPDFTATDLDGNKVSLSQYRGKVLVINYFATWCPPCRAEIPDFIAAYTELKDKGLEFIGVSNGEDPEDVRAFVREHGIPYPVIAGDREMATKFGDIRAVPVSIFIDRTGKVAQRVEGMLTRGELDRILRPLVAAAPQGETGKASAGAEH